MPEEMKLAERMNLARTGDPDAVLAILGRFEPELRVVARGLLPRRLRSQFDSADIMQSLWRIVFKKDGPAPERFENSRHFCGYLKGIVRKKVLQARRRRVQTQKCAIGREEPLYVHDGDRELPRELPGNSPTPSQEVQALDVRARILEGRGDRDRRIFELRREGFTYPEIAEQLGMADYAVRRVVEAMRERMEARGWH